MKKILIRLQPSYRFDGRTIFFEYPDRWGDVNGNRITANPDKEFINEEGPHECSTLDQVWWISGPDEIIVEIMADPKVTQITFNEANSLGKAWQGERKHKITDAQAVLNLILHLPDNRILNVVDQIRAQGFGGAEQEMSDSSNIIDPDDPAPGINRPKEFNISDYVNEGELNEETS
jgi:hypothetical protein